MESVYVHSSSIAIRALKVNWILSVTKGHRIAHDVKEVILKSNLPVMLVHGETITVDSFYIN